MATGIVSQTNAGQQTDKVGDVPIPNLFQPLEDLGIKLNIRKDLFERPEIKAFQKKEAAQRYLNQFIGKYSGATGRFTHREYLQVLLDVAAAWGLIDKSDAIREKERLKTYLRVTPNYLLNQNLTLGKAPNLFEKVVTDTQLVAGSSRLDPVRDLIRKLPEKSKLRTATLNYLSFRDLSKREQWREVRKASFNALVKTVKLTEKVATKAVEIKDKSLAIFGEGYEWFWNDTKFGQAIRAERDKAMATYRKRIMEPVARTNAALDKKFVEPVREEVIKPINLYGKSFFEDIKLQIQDPSSTKQKTLQWPNLSKANKALASEGRFDPIGKTAGVIFGKEKRKGKGFLQGFNFAEILVSSAIKTVVGTIRGVVTAVKPVNQVVTTIRQFSQDRITAVKSGLSSIVRPWMTERWNGLTSAVSKVANTVRTGWRIGSNVVGALGDAAIPTALTFILTGGNPIAAGAVGITSLGGSAAARYLNAVTVGGNYTLQREFIFKYGSFLGKERVIAENLRNFAPDLEKVFAEHGFSKSDIRRFISDEAAKAGGSSRISMAAGSARAFSLGMTLGFAMGLGPLGAAGFGLAFASGSFALSSIRNAISIGEFARNLNTFGFFELPGNQVLGAYLGGKWLQEQIHKMFTNKRYLQEEWLNMSLAGGLGNTLSLVSGTASAIGVGRWAINSVNAIGNNAALKIIGGSATVARAIGWGSLAGSTLGAVVGWYFFGIPPGVGALVGGFVGGVAGGIIGAAAAAATGGAATPAIFAGSFGGSFIGSLLGSFVDFLIDNARRAAEAFANFLGILSIAKFLATLATVLTAPLRKLTDYVELVAPIAMGLITIAMITIGTSQSASNTPVSGGAGTGSTERDNVIASIISPFISDISAVSKKEKLEISTSEKISVKSCYNSSDSNYYLKENGRYLNLKKNHGLTLSAEQKVSILNPIETTVFFSGESPLYIKSESGEFIKSGEKALILTPNTLTSSYFILLEGITSDLSVGDKIKENYLLGDTIGTNFRISVLTDADTTGYNPEMTIDPCSESTNINFPGFTCDIIPQFQEICVND